VALAVVYQLGCCFTRLYLNCCGLGGFTCVLYITGKLLLKILPVKIKFEVREFIEKYLFAVVHQL